MLGAIIGDLAAWTYERDKQRFYDDLVSPEAELSVYGEAALAAAEAVCDDNLSRMECRHCHSSRIEDVGPLLLQALQSCWTDDSIYEVYGQAQHLIDHVADKAEYYFLRIAVDALYKIRRGATKSTAFEENVWGVQLDLDHWADKDINEVSSCLTYLALAKDCLIRSWDFTSALHLAVKKTCDLHFLLPLIGIFADAMYGCDQVMLKMKYYQDVAKPVPFPGHYADAMYKIRRYDRMHRFFFPKNSARTNVEKTTWTPYHSNYEGIEITAEIKRRITISFEPGWEDRYGFYYENGWYYVCRSFFLMHRFRIVPISDSAFKIVDLQRSEAKQAQDEYDIEGALYSVEYHWDYLKPENE